MLSSNAIIFFSVYLNKIMMIMIIIVTVVLDPFIHSINHNNSLMNTIRRDGAKSIDGDPIHSIDFVRKSRCQSFCHCHRTVLDNQPFRKWDLDNLPHSRRDNDYDTLLPIIFILVFFFFHCRCFEIISIEEQSSRRRFCSTATNFYS